MLAFVAAEAREFLGLLRHAERAIKLNWPVDFARKIWLNGKAAVLVANGPGPNANALTDPDRVEPLIGQSILNGVPVTVKATPGS